MNDLDKVTQTDIDLLTQYPHYFIEEVFDEKLWNKQIEIVLSVRDNKRTTVRSCHGSGKSFTSARIALTFLTTHPNSKVITTAPTFLQVENILWREIRNANKKAAFKLTAQPLKTELSVSEDWFAIGLSTDEPDRIQGFHAVYILFIVDEAAGVPRNIIEAAQGIVSSDQARELYLGNPTSKDGVFYETFKNPNFTKIKIAAWDTPNFTAFGITREDIINGTWQQKITGPLPAPYLITPDWVADKVARWGVGTPMWQGKIEGEFPDQDDNALIPLSMIEFARTNVIEPKENDPQAIGADFARFGEDKTEYCYRKGAQLQDWKTVTKIDTVTNTGELQLFMGFHPFAYTNGDEGGLGVGIVDNLKSNNPTREVNGINSASEPIDKEQFVNIRAEMFWGLRDRFMTKEIDLSKLPQDVYDDLSSQLANLKYKFTPTGKRQLESKEDMKKRGLPSPDKADALALCFMHVNKSDSLIDYLKSMK